MSESSGGPDGDALRQQVAEWISDNWDTEITLAEWWRRLGESGWGFPHWPREWCGRGLSAVPAAIASAELRRSGVIGPPPQVGTTLGLPSLIHHGSDHLKNAFVRALATGEEAWCQLFSEPGAGSDLSSLQTRAIRDGDEWIVNGQKVWTSQAHIADRGILLARTDIDVPKHRGITFFVIDIDQPGVEIRPLRQMNGGAEFNEVFLTDARVGNDRIVGNLNEGWAVAQTTLTYERTDANRPAYGSAAVPGRKAGMLTRTVGEILADRTAARPRRGNALGRKKLIELARQQGVANDPVVRQRLMEFYIASELFRYNGLRAKASRNRGPGGSGDKIALANLARMSRELSLSMLGAQGMLAGKDAPNDGEAHLAAVSSVAISIAGGSDEILRNVIGERVLELPREPQTDRDIPFRDLRVGTIRA